MPTDIHSQELSNIFRVDIANILVRPHKKLYDHIAGNNRTQVEAWIYDVGDEQSAQQLANRKRGLILRGLKIQCQVIKVPLKVFQLCKQFEKGSCSFSIGCIYEHIRCREPVTCQNTRCWYGHDRERVVKSENRPQSGK